MALSLSGDGTLSGVDIAASGLGRVLQIVRATDSTQRTTTSTSLSDITGMSVTITPQKADSTILVVATYRAVLYTVSGSDILAFLQITDSANNALSGAQGIAVRQKGASGTPSEAMHYQTPIGFDSPATTSAVTYKMRFYVQSSSYSLSLRNDQNTGQMYAIEVSA